MQTRSIPTTSPPPPYAATATATASAYAPEKRKVIQIAKNKMPASIQLTSEQLIRDSRAHSQSLIPVPPKRKFVDSSELDDYLLSTRKRFEDSIRFNRGNINLWIKYADWEAKQGNFDRSRSVWERALDVDYKNPTLWVKYAEFESVHKFLNHSRNVWDRAITLLPCVFQLWLKYIHFEEILGNLAAARQIFQRWMNWKPDHQAWISFINFELRYGEIENARALYERFVDFHCVPISWIKYAKFEFKNGEIDRARNVYLRAVDKLVKNGEITEDDDNDVEQLFVSFAEFEVLCKEIERARCLYKYALEHFPKRKTELLDNMFLAFEKQHGNQGGIEDAIVEKKRVEYENLIKINSFDYDSWFDYIRLEESAGNIDIIREIYERAIATVPPADEKYYWQRYIFFWINYALFEEIVGEDVERTRAVYNECLKLIPHHKFSFAKMWVLAAQFELRQLNLQSARMILGNAIGRAPKDKIFKKYIELELQLGNFNRCRKLYEKYLEWSPSNCYAWTKYAELETSLCETERARGIFEIAISQPSLDMPELLWKAYIDFEMSEGEHERARKLYQRLLDRTKNLKVWVSYARFEASAMGKDSLEEQKLCIQKARNVFYEAINYYTVYASELKEERAMLLNEWLQMEGDFNELGDVSLVQAMLKKIKRVREVAFEDGLTNEEFVDYIFPNENEAQVGNLKILEAAYKWKKSKTSCTTH